VIADYCVARIRRNAKIVTDAMGMHSDKREQTRHCE
jgi:hypothetical protein